MRDGIEMQYSKMDFDYHVFVLHIYKYYLIQGWVLSSTSSLPVLLHCGKPSSDGRFRHIPGFYRFFDVDWSALFHGGARIYAADVTLSGCSSNNTCLVPQQQQPV